MITRKFCTTCPSNITEYYLTTLGDPIDFNLPVLRKIIKTKRGHIPSNHPLSNTWTHEFLNKVDGKLILPGVILKKPFQQKLNHQLCHGMSPNGTNSLMVNINWESCPSRIIPLDPQITSLIIHVPLIIPLKTQTVWVVNVQNHLKPMVYHLILISTTTTINLLVTFGNIWLLFFTS